MGRVPIDSFDSAPLKYKRLDGAWEGFVVTSSGPKGDSEGRIARIQGRAFDQAAFQALSEDDYDSLRYTMWSARRR